jgi:pimeloyl-ACP methyl ester carboxylesterase
MSGMSRSLVSIEACRKVTPKKLALQINNLLERLAIDNATVWRCSSGALCALGLCAYYPDRIRNVFMHEAPLQLLDMLKDLPMMEGWATVEAMVPLSRQMAGDAKAQAAWDHLPKEVHARIEKNFIVWAHGYISDLTFNLPLSDEDLHQRPIAWSVGRVRRWVLSSTMWSRRRRRACR